MDVPLPDDIDAALGGLCAAITGHLSASLVGIYLEGSLAWGNPVDTSDLDLRVVVREQPADATKAVVEEQRAETEAALGREVGLSFERLDVLIRVGALRFQRSRLLSGEDLRGKVPAKTIDAFVRDSMLSAHDLIVGLRTHHGQTPRMPLTAPVPEAEFRGYDIREILDGGRWVRSSKRLVSNVTAAATAMIAAKARVFVFTKGEVPALYATHIGDEWTELVVTIYDDCRMRAGYRLPEEPADRAALTKLCDRAVTFENRLIEESMPMLHELAANGAEKQKAGALRRLTAIGQLPET
jgi:predicted nucleotidyltransferase